MDLIGMPGEGTRPTRECQGLYRLIHGRDQRACGSYAYLVVGEAD